MRRILFIAILAASTAVLADGRGISRVNGDIHAQAGQAYGDLETVNGAIVVDAGVAADEVETVNGSVRLGDGAKAASVEVVNGEVELGANVEITNTIETVNGAVSIGAGSHIGRHIETVNGTIELRSTTVGRNVETVNGDIVIGTGSIVRGDLIVHESKGMSFGKKRKPKVTIEAGATIEGKLDLRREVELHLDPGAKVGQVLNVER